MKTAIFPGSFDPITLGHKDIIEKSLNIFDSVIIGIGQNSEKKYMFSAERRKQFVEEAFKASENNPILVDSSFALTLYPNVSSQTTEKSSK